MEYDIEKIRQIAAKYYDGESSVEEERLLREFFGSMQMASVPQDLRPLARMLGSFRSMSQERMPVRRVKRCFLLVAASVAALVLILLRPSPEVVYGYDSDGKEITDPQQAMAMSASVFSDFSAFGEAVNSAEEILEFLN